MPGPLHRTALAAIASLVITSAGAACTAPEPTVAPREPCRSIVDEAAVAMELDQQVALLDDALVVCRDVAALDRALAAHPGAVAVDGATFAARRCTDPPDDRVLSSTICRTVAPPTTTTLPPESPGSGVYVGITLDGREVEILASDTLFTQGRPVPIVQIVDIGTEDGCEGVEAEYERWLAGVPNPVFGDFASVYAQHALNVLSTLGCPPPD